MGLKRREFTKAFKLQVIAEVEAGASVVASWARTSGECDNDCEMAQATSAVQRQSLCRKRSPLQR